jgi:PAS domain S-box-containing protein
MRAFRNRSIGRQLTLIALLTNGVALVLAFVGFMAHEVAAFRRSAIEEHQTAARMLAEHCTASIASGNARGAARQLASVAPHSAVDAVVIFDASGKPFAMYERPGATKAPAYATVPEDGANWGLVAFEFVEPVGLSGRRIGTILVSSNLRDMRDRLVISGTIGLSVLVLAGFVAWCVMIRLQRFVTAPVSHLVDVASEVAAHGNYSVRAVKQSNDELGRLVDTFNTMLDQIELGDRALRETHDRLELRVEERTRELQQEIAERKRSEQALHESHQRLEIVTRATTDAVWDWNVVEGTIVWNENYKTLFGYRLDDVPKTVEEWKDRVHPDDQGVVVKGLVESLDGQQSLWSAEYRYRRSDGTHAFVFDRGYIIRNEQGQPVRMIGAIQDVSERKRAQEEIATERARFKFIFDSVPVGISLMSANQPETNLVNPAHARITGIAAEDIHLPDVFARATHPDDYERQRPLVQAYKRGEIDRFTLEKRYLHPDGRTVWATMTRRMFTDPVTGRKQSITTIVDISELKAAQEQAARDQARFKFIFEAVPVGISLVLPGEDGTHLVNPAHERITGVSLEDSKQTGVFARVSHPDDLRQQEELVKRYVAGEIDHFSLEKRYLHPEGRTVWAALTSRMFTDPVTGRKLSVTTLVDITERKHAEAKLAETHRQLLETSRQAGMAEVATGVLHNVGNVLNSVNVSTTLLSDLVRQSKIDRVSKLRDLVAAHEADLATFFTRDPRGKQVPGFLQTLSTHLAKERGEVLAELEALRKNIEHIKDIVAMQQNYARVSGVSETVSVAELIDDALRMNAGAFERHGVQLVRDFKVVPQLTVEKHKVLQILVNLMRNAKYACDESGRNDKQVTLRVTAERGRVKIAVIDNGVGIPAENLTRIFGHGFTTRKDGHGFGLHSGALAARELGGSLTASSEGPGRGATFTLDLPECSEMKAA